MLPVRRGGAPVVGAVRGLALLRPPAVVRMVRAKFPERVFVSLPEGTLARLQAIAEEKGLTVSCYVRLAVMARLHLEERDRT